MVRVGFFLCFKMGFLVGYFFVMWRGGVCCLVFVIRYLYRWRGDFERVGFGCLS